MALRPVTEAIGMFVLHFLPDAGKRALPQGVADRLRPEAPALVASGSRVTEAWFWARMDLTEV